MLLRLIDLAAAGAKHYVDIDNWPFVYGRFYSCQAAGLVTHRSAKMILALSAPWITVPAFVLIDDSTPKASGLGQDSMESELFVATLFADQVDGVIGKLSADQMRKVDACLKVALSLQ